MDIGVMVLQGFPSSFLFLILRTALCISVPVQCSKANDLESDHNEIVHKQTSQPRRNVLFIVADDMRPQLGCYAGADFPSARSPKMRTPGLDRLARQSFVAGRAYAQYAMCGPSRTSLLTGRRPSTTHVYDNLSYFRRVGGNFTTLPQYFKQNDYVSVGMGKIFHPGEQASGNDDPASWSEPYWHAPNEAYWWLNKTRSWLPVSKFTRSIRPLPDEQITEHAKETLRRLAEGSKSGKQPFFMAVGYLKPHLPFIFPEEYLEVYPQKAVQLPRNEFAPSGLPSVAWNPYYELRSYRDIARLGATGAINTTLPKTVVRALRRAYYSALSYTDSLIGSLLDQLEQLGLRSNTIVSFIGDHGWQLGEHGEWCKQTDFDLATHAPLMISVPGAAHRYCEQLIEFVDLFPTVVDLAGLPAIPPCGKQSQITTLCTEGVSFAPLVVSPRTNRAAKERTPLDKAFSQFHKEVNGHQVMGYTIRTDRYRYTEWVRFMGKPHYQPVWNNIYGRELYDHHVDRDENRNRVQDAQYTKVVKRLSKELRRAMHS